MVVSYKSLRVKILVSSAYWIFFGKEKEQQKSEDVVVESFGRIIGSFLNQHEYVDLEMKKETLTDT